MKIAGWVLSVLLAALFAMSIYTKLVPPQDAAANIEKVGLTPDLMKTIGLIELVIVVLYVLPPTAVLGSILLTGYMGGAIVIHLRMGEGIVFQFLIGVIAWFGCALRQPEVFRLVWGGVLPFWTKSTDKEP